MILPSKQK